MVTPAYVQEKIGILDAFSRSAALTSGALESSNVDVAGQLVAMIALSRQFDMQVQLLHRADENARATSAIVSLT